MFVYPFEVFTSWLLHYGPVILFLVLVLGIVALPIPDESLLTLAGYLVANGKLSMFPTLFAAISGSICGISLSYYLGKVTGPVLLRRYGPRFNITQEKVAKASLWLAKIGKWGLLICYFIPLVRHLAGYLAGSSKLKFTTFMVFAYTGAVMWVLIYLSMGYLVKNLHSIDIDITGFIF